MINRELIKEIIITSEKDIQKKKIVRRRETEVLKKYLERRQAVFVSGVRRSGKSFIMFGLIQELLMRFPNNVCYINFEDERLTSDEAQLDLIYQAFIELKNPTGKIYFFFDEIQNINKWEKFIARMYEKQIKFFVSGSTSLLLSSVYSQSLTARNKIINVFPLSFVQFLEYKNPDLLRDKTTEGKAKIQHYLKEYVKWGGFPEVVYDGETDVLQDYYRDIIARDIVMRHNVSFKESLKQMGLFLLTNIGRNHSLYSLNKIIGARSVNTIKNYLSYLEEANLIIKIPFFSYSLKKQLSNPFKIYCIDSGLRNSVAFQFSEDLSWQYENIVAIELLRRNAKENVYFWKDATHEVDFVVSKGYQINELIQVCFDMTRAAKTRKREIEGLIEGARELKCENLLIITNEEEGEEEIKGKKIKIIPIAKWLVL